jgi:hypothetical protein
MNNEEKIMKELREKGGKLLTDYNLLITDDNPSQIPPEQLPGSTKRGAWWKILLFFFGPLLFIFIYSQIEGSDIFQRTVNPQKYWRTQVATLEEDIYKTQLYIKDWEDSSSRKDKISINYDSLVRKLIIEGKDPHEAKQIASDDIKAINKAEKETDATMIKVRKQMLETSYKLLDDYKRQLVHAKKELESAKR